MCWYQERESEEEKGVIAVKKMDKTLTFKSCFAPLEVESILDSGGRIWKIKLVSEQRWDALQHIAALFCAVEYPQLLDVYIGIISDSRKNVPGC